METVLAILSEGFQAIYTTLQAEAEVMNGGLHQYFFNTDGQFAALAVYGFRLIGAVKHAEAMERAIEVFTEAEESVPGGGTSLSMMMTGERFSPEDVRHAQQSLQENGELPPDLERRLAELYAASAREMAPTLDPLEEIFFSGEENLPALRIRFIRAHPEQFPGA